MSDIKFTDNTDKILKAFKKKSGVALNLIGTTAARYTGDYTPVRTGNLKNHIDWEVGRNENYVEVGFKHDEDPDSNPDYAEAVENGGPNNKPQHMLQRGCTEPAGEFKKITEQVYGKN